ncbi:MAG: family 43 glycosylhydrolase [Clostridia bacterium]|nr:family 43 glycosylhydrolase [Clostridia bacterium]
MKSKTNRIIKAFSAILVISMLLAIPFISPSAEVEAAESITLTFDGSTYTNPVAVGADPFVLTHDGKYYMYSTNAANSGYVVYYSDDLVNWFSGGYCLRTKDVAIKPDDTGFWAPEVLEYNGTFYMIYTCDEQLGIATSDSPLGPFTDTVGAIFPNQKTIDGHFFVDDDNKIYLYYVITKQWTDVNRYGNRIYGVEFDMEKLETIGTPVELIAPKISWELQSGYIAEGPEMLKHNGKYYLSYSANGYAERSYSIGYATATSPLGAYTKASAPILETETSKGVYAPGHHSFAYSPDGTELFIIYHKHSASVYKERHVSIDRAKFNSDGTLSVVGPTVTPQAMPSGAKTDDYEVELKGEFAALATLPTVYVHQHGGSDSNSGSSSAPLATLTAAYKKLSKGGTIVLLSQYDATNETDTSYFSTPKTDGPIMLRGINPGIRLSHGYVSLNSAHYLDNLQLRILTNTSLIEAQFNSLIIGERISSTESPSDTGKKYSFLIGGHMQYNVSADSPYKYFVPAIKTYDTVSCNKEYTLEVYGGSWRSIRAGNWRWQAIAEVGVFNEDVTLKIGGNTKVSQSVTAAYENYGLSVTGSSSLAKGATARLIITGGTIEIATYVAGRIGTVDKSVSSKPFIEGNLEAYVSNATFNRQKYTNNSAITNAPARILPLSDKEVAANNITAKGDYLLELSGNVVFTEATTVNAKKVDGKSSLYRTKAHDGNSFTDFDSTYYVNFLDVANGNDANDGTCPEKALATLGKCFTDLAKHDSHTVICDMTMTNSAGYSSSYRRVFRSSFAGVDHPGINLTKNNKIALTLKCSATFDKLHINSEVKDACIALGMANATFTESVNCTVSNGGDYPLLVGGRPVFNTHESTINDKYNIGSKDEHHVQSITVNGGTWSALIGGNYRIGTESSVGTLWEDLTVNIGGKARFNRTVKTDDIGSITFSAAGMNIQKGSVTLNITGGTFETPVYAITRMGELASNRRHLIPAGLWGEGMDLAYELDVKINVSGGDFTKAGKIGFTSFPGETPIHGNATLNITGGTFAADTVFCGAGVAKGTSAVTGLTTAQAAKASGFDTVNGKATGDDELRILCVGDSITFGTGSKGVTVGGYTYPKENYNYPTMLEKLLAENGVRAEVVNCGFGGSIASLEDTDLTYRFSGAYNRSLASEPDVIVIALGTNNHSRASFDYGRRDFEDGMMQLIEDYHSVFPSAKIYVTTAIPRFDTDEKATAVVANIIPIQKKMAEKYDYCELIDLYTALFDRADLDHFSTDKLHPKNKGYEAMAEEVYNGITGKALTGSKLISEKLSTVYVSANGSGDGSSAAKATNNVSLAMARLPDNGGTMVVVDSIDFTDYFFTDPRLKSLDIKGATAASKVSLKGSALIQTIPTLNIDDITLVNDRSMPYLIAANYNTLNVGSGVTCVKGTYQSTSSGVTTTHNAPYDPFICAGFYVTAKDSVEGASSSKDCRITVAGGSWNIVRGGNFRSASSTSKSAPLGVYSGDLTIKVCGNATLTSKNYQDYATYVTTATGMNYHKGSAKLILDGVTVNGGVYAICRPAPCEEGTTPGYGIEDPYSGSVTIIVNGSTINSPADSVGIMATQDIDPADFTGEYTLVLVNSTVNNSVAVGNHPNNNSTVKLCGSVTCTPTAFTNTVNVPVGDINLDGRINSLDAATMSRYIAGWSEYADAAITGVADLNSDGKVNSLDAAILSRHIAGWSEYATLPITD